MDIQVGEHTNNYPEIAAKDKLTELQLRARQLLDQVEQIQKEQNYQRVRRGDPNPLFFPSCFIFLISLPDGIAGINQLFCLLVCFLTLFYICWQYREERFRMTSESTNQRVLWWSIAQTIILILTGVWQMRHLKSFFEAKKLV